MAFEDCIRRIKAASERELSDADIENIVSRVNQRVKEIQNGIEKDPNQIPFGGPLSAIVDRAAEEAAQAYVADNIRKLQNDARQIIKINEVANEIKDMKDMNFARAAERTIVVRADTKSNIQSFEQLHAGYRDSMLRRIVDTWDALGKDWWGFFQDVEKQKLLLMELKGQDSGDPMAKKGAKAWLETSEMFRQKFNELGGDIGKLVDWAMPQHHSMDRVLRAGKESWINDILPAIDRERYVDDLGNQWNDQKMQDFLGHAWDTIASGGWANIDPGKYQGVGAIANRHAEARQIHFKDVDSQLNYWAKYGEKTFPEIMMGHVDRLSRDMALIDKFGPNPDMTFRTIVDMAKNSEAFNRPVADKDIVHLTNIWNTATGKTPTAIPGLVKDIFTGIRNLNVAGKLGMAPITSFFGDKAMFEAARMANNLPAFQTWYNELRMMNPANGAERRMLQRNALMLEDFRSALAKFGEDYGGSSFLNRVANASQRLTGMNFVNNTRRGAFGLQLMSSLGDMVKTQEFHQATETDMHLLRSYGITKADWDVWKLAPLEDLGHGNSNSLTPAAIAAIPDEAIHKTFGSHVNADKVRLDAEIKLLGAINSESRYAVVEPGLRQRAQLFSTLQRGTIKGELTASFWQFKTFPLAQFEKALDIAASRPNFGGKARMLAAIMAMQTLAGAMILQTKDVLNGKDPRDMTDWRFLAASFFAGGSLGLYGDFVYGATKKKVGGGALEMFAGPTIGTGLDLLNTVGSAHPTADLLRIGKGFVPMSNYWATKAAMDHLVFQQFQEMASPGYLISMKARSQKDYNQQWWWNPGEFAPERAPDFAQAIQ
jgi:hypothetical protein